MILFALIYDKSQIHIGTVLYQIVYSTCVDLFANCHIYSTYKWINFLIMLLGVVLFAVGTGLYASASLGRGSYEAVTFALAEKNHWQIRFVRMTLDILVVVTGVLFGGKFGVCTLITVIISGPIIQFVNANAIAATQSCIQNLYVACTRAKEVLYIIAPEAENESVFMKMLKDSI